MKNAVKGNVFRSTWERASSFIVRAGTVILLASIFIWFTSSYGWECGQGPADGQKGLSVALSLPHGAPGRLSLRPLGEDAGEAPRVSVRARREGYASQDPSEVREQAEGVHGPQSSPRQ